jgi:hypothetical protein
MSHGINKTLAQSETGSYWLPAPCMPASRTSRWPTGGRGAMNMCRAASGHLGPTGTRNVDVARLGRRNSGAARIWIRRTIAIKRKFLTEPRTRRCLPLRAGVEPPNGRLLSSLNKFPALRMQKMPRRRFTSQQRSSSLRSSLCLPCVTRHEQLFPATSTPPCPPLDLCEASTHGAQCVACFYFRTRIGATSSPTPSRVAVAWSNHGRMRCTVFASVAPKPATGCNEMPQRSGVAISSKVTLH